MADRPKPPDDLSLVGFDAVNDYVHGRLVVLGRMGHQRPIAHDYLVRRLLAEGNSVVLVAPESDAAALEHRFERLLRVHHEDLLPKKMPPMQDVFPEAPTLRRDGRPMKGYELAQAAGPMNFRKELTSEVRERKAKLRKAEKAARKKKKKHGR